MSFLALKDIMIRVEENVKNEKEKECERNFYIVHTFLFADVVKTSISWNSIIKNMAQKNGEEKKKIEWEKYYGMCVFISSFSAIWFIFSNRAKNDGNGDGIIKLLLKVPSP